MDVGLHVRCCTTAGISPTVHNTNTYSYQGAVAFCSGLGKALCPAATLAAWAGTTADNTRVWTSTFYSDSTSATCAYGPETGLCGLDGFSLTTAFGAAPRPIIAVPLAESLFNNPDGQACNISFSEVTHASAMASASSLVQSVSAIGPLDDEDSVPVLRSEIVEPELVIDDDDAVSLLAVGNDDATEQNVAESFAESAVPAAMGARAGVIDESLRPAGHKPLASRRLALELDGRNEAEAETEIARPDFVEDSPAFQTLPMSGRLERHEEAAEEQSIPMKRLNHLSAISTFEPSAVDSETLAPTRRHDDSAVSSIVHSLQNQDSNPSPVQTQGGDVAVAVPADQSLQRMAIPDSQHDLLGLQHALMSFVSAHMPSVVSSHHSVSAEPAYQDHPYFDVHQQLLAQLSATGTTNTSLTTTTTTTTTTPAKSLCPPTCSATLCSTAQLKCATINKCKNSCVNDICTLVDPNTAVSQAVACDQRMASLLTTALAEQKALESESDSFRVTLKGTPLSECPGFVAGTEPWNIAPYDQNVVAWTLAMLPQIENEITQRSAVRNTTVTAPKNSTTLMF